MNLNSSNKFSAFVDTTQKSHNAWQRDFRPVRHQCLFLDSDTKVQL